MVPCGKRMETAIGTDWRCARARVEKKGLGKESGCVRGKEDADGHDGGRAGPTRRSQHTRLAEEGR